MGDANDIIHAKSASQTQLSTLIGEFCVYAADFCHLCLISRQKAFFCLEMTGCDAFFLKNNNNNNQRVRIPPKNNAVAGSVTDRSDRRYRSAVYTQCKELLVVYPNILNYT